MNVRVEIREGPSWEQPVVVIHPDRDRARRYAIVCADAIRASFGRAVRCTVGETEGQWAEGEVVYERG